MNAARFRLGASENPQGNQGRQLCWRPGIIESAGEPAPVVCDVAPTDRNPPAIPPRRPITWSRQSSRTDEREVSLDRAQSLNLPVPLVHSFRDRSRRSLFNAFNQEVSEAILADGIDLLEFLFWLRSAGTEARPTGGIQRAFREEGAFARFRVLPFSCHAL